MIHAIGAAHAALRATKRSKPPENVIVEVRKRRRIPAEAMRDETEKKDERGGRTA
jgi:hypothetical protein